MLFFNAGIAKGFTQAAQSQLIRKRIASFKIHRITQICSPHRAHIGLDALSHSQQQGCDKCHKPKWVVEHHQPSNVFISQQSLGAPEQPTLEAAVCHCRPVDFFR